MPKMSRPAPARERRGGAAPLDGFLNVCKPLGWTAHDVVQLIRRRTGLHRVGHAGTLDPAATGVLPVCLGRATRFAERVGAAPKVYVADVALGAKTDTADAEGRVLQVAPAAGVAVPLEAVVEALARLVGTYPQVPPEYSAIKVGGEAAYARARRGEAVRLAPRPVTVYSMALVDWEPPRFAMVVRCSAGTYVRALARDVGAVLGCGAYLDGLVRIAVGRFTLAGSVTVERFEQAAAEGTWPALVEPPDWAVDDLPAVLLGPATSADFAHGRAWRALGGVRPCAARAYGPHGQFLGLVKPDASGQRWQPAVSFVYDADAGGG